MVATRCARLRRAAIATGFDGGDPLRAAAPRLRSPRGLMVATRCARLRRACDRHGFDGGDPLRAAAPRLAIATGSDGGDPLRAAAPRCDRHGV
ncbi:hypothetical protein ACQKB1_07140 [Mycobacterium tuberculosis]